MNKPYHMRTSEYNIYIYFKDDIILFLYVSYQSFKRWIFDYEFSASYSTTVPLA